MTEVTDTPLIPGPSTPPQPTTASAMLDMLRRHYLPDERRPAYLLAPEIQAPGRSSRRADLIALGMSAATNGALIGHEIKVTRADVQAELGDLTKSDPWGIMLPPSGRRTRSVVRPFRGLRRSVP